MYLLQRSRIGWVFPEPIFTRGAVFSLGVHTRFRRGAWYAEWAPTWTSGSRTKAYYGAGGRYCSTSPREKISPLIWCIKARHRTWLRQTHHYSISFQDLEVFLQIARNPFQTFSASGPQVFQPHSSVDRQSMAWSLLIIKSKSHLFQFKALARHDNDLIQHPETRHY